MRLANERSSPIEKGYYSSLEQINPWMHFEQHGRSDVWVPCGVAVLGNHSCVFHSRVGDNEMDG